MRVIAAGGTQGRSRAPISPHYGAPVGGSKTEPGTPRNDDHRFRAWFALDIEFFARAKSAAASLLQKPRGF
jgi:hypothetical protein